MNRVVPHDTAVGNRARTWRSVSCGIRRSRSPRSSRPRRAASMCRLPRASSMESEQFGRVAPTEDLREGLNAWRERRRTPVWRGPLKPADPQALISLNASILAYCHRVDKGRSRRSHHHGSRNHEQGLWNAPVRQARTAQKGKGARPCRSSSATGDPATGRVSSERPNRKRSSAAKGESQAGLQSVALRRSRGHRFGPRQPARPGSARWPDRCFLWGPRAA